MDNNDGLFNCNICNKKYSSYKSLWNHNKKIHTKKDKNVINIVNNNVKKVNNTLKSLTCDKCGKIFNNRPAKSIHKKTCKLEIIELKEEINELKKIINNTNINTQNNTNINTQNNTNINNNTQNINNTNNNLIINQIGRETYANLPSEDIKKFIKNGNYLVNIVDLLNFNEKLPENHNFCNTSLEGKYVSVLNPETNIINKVNKNNFYNKVLEKSFEIINNIILTLEYDEDFNKNIKEKYKIKLENKINELTDNFYKDKSYKNSFKQDINQLSYNKKNIILETWRTLKKLEKQLIEDDNSDSTLASNSDSSNSDSDSDSDLDHIL
jgi:hypothetical protein